MLSLLKSNIFTGIVAGALGEWLNTWYDKETKYNNMIYIYPLWKMGEPFAAGITGGQHIIPGYVDQRFADPHLTGSLIQPQVLSVSDDYDKGLYGDATEGEETAESVPAGNGKWIHPLGQKTSITSPYGPRSRNGKNYHHGTDLAPYAKGVETPTFACADGKVVAAGFSDSMGYYVTFKVDVGGKDYVITYMHHKKGTLKVKAGDTVKAGTQFGIMGTTGDSDGVHLHIELEPGNVRQRVGRVDPVEFFKKQGVSL